jgi:hypothetical protein
MREDKFKRLVGEALGDYLRSPEGEALVGGIVVQAVNQALTRELRFEDGTSEPGRVVEKTERWNLLDWLAVYLPRVEGAVRGAQADAAGARNRAGETRDGMRLIAEFVARAAGALEAVSGERVRLDGAGAPAGRVLPP